MEDFERPVFVDFRHLIASTVKVSMIFRRGDVLTVKEFVSHCRLFCFWSGKLNFSRDESSPRITSIWNERTFGEKASSRSTPSDCLASPQKVLSLRNLSQLAPASPMQMTVQKHFLDITKFWAEIVQLLPRFLNQFNRRHAWRTLDHQSHHPPAGSAVGGGPLHANEQNRQPEASRRSVAGLLESQGSLGCVE